FPPFFLAVGHKSSLYRIFLYLLLVLFTGNHGILIKRGHKRICHGSLVRDPTVGNAVAYILFNIIAKGKPTVQVEAGPCRSTIEMIVPSLNPTQFGEVQDEATAKYGILTAIKSRSGQGQ